MKQEYAQIPLQWIGPIKISGPEIADEVEVPLATFESPLWPSVERGAACTRQAGGIRSAIVDDRMTRSVLVEATDVLASAELAAEIRRAKDEIARVTCATSRHLKFVDIHIESCANLIYIRLEMQTGDASGHNMLTKAADKLLSWLLAKYPALRYVSISGNYCTDKKVSAVNGILGRGKAVICDVLISKRLVAKYLKTTPDAIVQLHIKKNLIGSILAGSIRSANAHFANMLLAIYLATGQDAANIVEGSQGIVHAEVRNGDLYFSVTLPNIIVGCVGSGKELPFVQANLERLGCKKERGVGMNARRLAHIVGATCLCGELSLLASQTNPGELVSTHMRLERSAASQTGAAP